MAQWVLVAALFLGLAGADAQETVSPYGAPAPAATAPAAESPGRRAQPSQADLLATDSLCHSAMSMIHARWGVRARAGRLVALATYAQRLAPADPQTTWVLSNIYESRGQAADAEAVMTRRLQAEPNDFGLGLAYLRAGLSARAKPGDQQAFLASLLDKAGFADSLRAQAAVELGKMAQGNRENDQAVQWFTRALELDKLNIEATQGIVMAAGTEPSLPDTVRALITMLASSPRTGQLTRSLGAMMAIVGLHEQAAPFFDAMWEEAAADGATPPVEVAGQYLNSLLDSGRYAKAVEVFAPLTDKYATDRSFMLLVVEAYRAVGKVEQADEVARRIIADVEAGTVSTQPSTMQAAELAWMYTAYYPKADLALSYARQAAEAAPDDPILQRFLGAAEMLTGQEALVASGQDRLEKVKASDPMAAALLAEHYLATGHEAAGTEAIARALDENYSGWAYRRVRDLAAKRNLTLPPHLEAEAVRQILEQFDRRYLDMGQHPEKYLAVTLRALAEPWVVGEGLEIEAVLKNTGDLPVPVGPGGLIRPTLSLEATAPEQTREHFTNLPMVVWPAPKYLPPGASVSAVVRLDVGSLDYFLTRHPLDNVTLTITGMLDPEPKGRATVSAVPAVPVEPLTVTRQGLLGEVDPNAPAQWREKYEYALRVLMTDLVRGTVPQRMRAVRQLGELVTLARDVQLFKARLPEGLRGVIHKGVLLAMVQKALQDPSEVVRADMLVALGNAQMDDSITSVVAPAAGDGSPLVRFRLVELLMASGARGQEQTLARLSADPDPLVRQMAAAFGRTP